MLWPALLLSCWREKKNLKVVTLFRDNTSPDFWSWVVPGSCLLGAVPPQQGAGRRGRRGGASTALPGSSFSGAVDRVSVRNSSHHLPSPGTPCATALSLLLKRYFSPRLEAVSPPDLQTLPFPWPGPNSISFWTLGTPMANRHKTSTFRMFFLTSFGQFLGLSSQQCLPSWGVSNFGLLVTNTNVFCSHFAQPKAAWGANHLHKWCKPLHTLDAMMFLTGNHRIYYYRLFVILMIKQ